jgi:hypothetical protein
MAFLPFTTGGVMTICSRCFGEYDESEGFTAPMEVIGNIFLETVRSGVYRLCPDCKKELGILNLLGFGE